MGKRCGGSVLKFANHLAMDMSLLGSALSAIPSVKNMNLSSFFSALLEVSSWITYLIV